jgi:hypothetical protein
MEPEEKNDDSQWAERLIDSGWDLPFIICASVFLLIVLPGIFLLLVAAIASKG